MNIFYFMHKYLAIKRISNDQKKINKKVSFFGGKAASGYALAKNNL